MLNKPSYSVRLISEPDLIYIVDNYSFSNPTLTITNGVETVVKELANGPLKNSHRLFYRDTEGRVDEIIHKDGCFVRFAPGYRSEDAFVATLYPGEKS